MNRRKNLLVRAISFVERPADFFLVFCYAEQPGIATWMVATMILFFSGCWLVEIATGLGS